MRYSVLDADACTLMCYPDPDDLVYHFAIEASTLVCYSVLDGVVLVCLSKLDVTDVTALVC